METIKQHNEILTIFSPNIVHIGLTGKRGSGKTEASKCFRYYFPDWFIYRVGFSTNLKEILANATGGSVETIEKNKDTPYLRAVLQYLGSQMRALDRNSLIDACRKDLEFLLYQKQNCSADHILAVYEDVRKQEEVDFIRSVGAVDRAFIFLVERSAKTNPDAGWMTPLINQIDEHETEREVDRIKWDRTIDNSQTLVYLKHQIGYISGYIKERLEQTGYYNGTTTVSTK